MTSHRAISVVAVAGLWLHAALAQAQSYCRNYMAEQNNGYAGFYIDVENQVQTGDTLCRLSGLKVILGVGDGQTFTYVTHSGLQYNTEYTATGLLHPSSSEFQVNGVSVGTASGTFTPYQGLFDGNVIPTWAASAAEYAVVVEDVRLVPDHGPARGISFAEEANRPTPLFAFNPAGPRNTPLELAPGAAATLTVKFHIIPMPDVTANAPFVTPYGQSIHAIDPNKMTSDVQLTQRNEAEEKILKRWGIPKDYDEYGGLISALWHPKATGFFRVEQRNGFYWLIDPLGNPCFYKGVTTAPAPMSDRTPATQRRFVFSPLPDMTGTYGTAWSIAAWGDAGTYYYSFEAQNLITKYGLSSWQQDNTSKAIERMHTWGFSGLGKFSDPVGMPYLPGLTRGAVANAYATSHPDIFDVAVQSQLKTLLTSQITPQLNNPMIIGWSLGNEDAEMVASWEVTDVFSLQPSTSPMKKALTDYALENIYGGDLQKLAAAWSIQALNEDAVLASNAAKLPSTDLETLRQYFEQSYYQFVYSSIKSIDPNHLYLGHWILIGGTAKDVDWQLLSQNVDVVGYDRYQFGLADDRLTNLLNTTNKPAFLGEFSFPPTYRMQRGFGAFGVYADDDAQAGNLYAEDLLQAVTNPYVIGVDWFQYRDEMITGRGPGVGTGLVYGEDYAFGIVDTTDTPKWEMVERMRLANLTVAPLRLLNSLR